MSLSTRDEPRQGSRVSVLAAAAALSGLIAITLFLPFLVQNTRYHHATLMLARYRAELAARPALEAALKQARLQISVLPALYRASSAALAAAAMQTDIKQISQASSADTRSMEMLAAHERGQFEIISLAGETAVAESHLGDFLYRVESHRPNLVFDAVAISSTAGQTQANSVGEPRLDLRWTVHGVRWKESK